MTVMYSHINGRQVRTGGYSHSYGFAAVVHQRTDSTAGSRTSSAHTVNELARRRAVATAGELVDSLSTGRSRALHFDVARRPRRRSSDHGKRRIGSGRGLEN
jgi:hypothetical protein